MSLFADADTLGGSFYREFNQSKGSKRMDHLRYFGNYPVARNGVCAGCCYHWIYYYLHHTELYSNEILEKFKIVIINVQRYVRDKNISLSILLEQSGFTPNGTKFQPVNNESDILKSVKIIQNNQGIYTMSFERHVVVCFMQQKRMLFMDVHRGDVWLPLTESQAWLFKYLGLMLQHKPIIIQGFNAVWPLMAQTKYSAITERIEELDRIASRRRQPVLRIRPSWQPDSQASSCPKCRSSFNLFTRKHHCRQCGLVVCSNCSSGRKVVALPAIRPGHPAETGQVRVCDDCN